MPGGVEHRRKPRWFWGNWLWLTSTVTLHFHTTIVPASLSGLPHWFLLLITRRTMVGRVVCFFASHHIHSPADSVSCRMLNNWTKWGNHSSPAALQMLAQCWVLTVLVASTLQDTHATDGQLWQGFGGLARPLHYGSSANVDSACPELNSPNFTDCSPHKVLFPDLSSTDDTLQANSRLSVSLLD